MGAWGPDSFENDDALDLVIGLERDGAAAIRLALEVVTGLGTRDYLEAPQASAAIAASEVVAAARDGELSRLPQAAQDWLGGHGESLAGPEFAALAHRAVERILAQSELKDLWKEGGAGPQSDAWANGVRQLIARLVATAPVPKARASKGRQVRKLKFGPGAVLRVDLDSQWHTYARILARNPMIAFYNCRVSVPEEDLLAIVMRPVLFVLAVGGRASKGHWPKIGDVPLETAPIPISDQFMQDIVSGTCEIVDEVFNRRPARPEECIALERAAVWEPAHVEERLRDHYAGRPNAHLAYMKVRLSAGG
jgi:Domain of unknown function (DUF4259)/Immunity protein 26